MVTIINKKRLEKKKKFVNMLTAWRKKMFISFLTVFVTKGM